ncbi:MarR family transcriptional regulator [Halalkaliarchaeum desulfuricum]|uniref:MarR family transcriptional regulator n=1 Tax=Halalkaliarchaeum desulfuricum TaxID=2055893 RepID=A0A343TNQ7_9EURY|nr:MarR family transcriptional regulator [Halalkaliarchaeum desulfuricum]AUX10729.1 MarR family transcriptional regulator [Halalkaliarchaeum desulfuricum]
MNRTTADAAAAALIGAVLLVGVWTAWQAYRASRTIDDAMGHHMDASVGLLHGVHPVWYLLGSVLVASVIGGVYVFVRGEVFDSEPAFDSGESTLDAGSPETNDGAAPGPEPDAPGGTTSNTTGDTTSNPTPVQRRPLDYLPEDERRILEPVVESPGLTQIEIRDRSDFSKSKVSQTVTDLEKRGLLYRERQGRTYRVYPADELADSRRTDQNL